MTIRRLFHFGPFIAIFITFTCYSVAVIDSYLWLAPPKYSIAGGYNLLVLTIWLSLILHNFFWAVMLGPGFVPRGWKPDDEDAEKSLQYCQTCEGFKPPRSHHCRTCKRCVMKMDHHCPWINTCCGHLNHTNFVLFLFFAPIGCIHSLIVCVWTTLYHVIWTTDLYRYYPPTVSFSVNAFLANLVAGGLAIGTILAVGMLFCQQARVVIANKTGIEQWIVDKANDRAAANNLEKFVYPYDLGRSKNISQVINWKCTPVGDGFSWPVAEGCTNYTLSIEQLEQKREKQRRIVIFEATEPSSGWWCPCSKGVGTCLCIPFSDEPRISLKIGDKLEVTRGTKYWLYGNKILSIQEQAHGKRVRGWFPKRSAIRLGKAIDLMGGDTDSKKTK